MATDEVGPEGFSMGKIPLRGRAGAANFGMVEDGRDGEAVMMNDLCCVALRIELMRLQQTPLFIRQGGVLRREVMESR